MKKIRILMIGPGHPSAANSGVGIVASSLEKELSKLVDLTVIQPDEVDTEKKEQFEIDIESKRFSDTNVVRDLVRISVKAKLDPYLYMGEEAVQTVENEQITESIQQELSVFSKSVVEKASEHDYDLIYVHDWIAAKAGLLLKELTGKPLVYHVHSLHVDRVSIKDKSWVYELEKEAIAKSDAVIAVSKFTADRIVKEYDGNPHKITVVYPAVPEIDMTKYAESPTDPTVLFLGRFARQKAPATFLNIAEKMIAKRNDVHFLMVGEGDQRTELIEMAAQRRLSANVHFEEHINHDEIEKVFARATMLCIPSISEPFGLTALEAAAAGKPIIVSDQSGVAEVLKGAQAVDRDDIGGYVKKIEQILADDKFTAKIIEENRKCIKTMSWPNVAQQIDNLFITILNK
jgi:glycogen(starch) synthase